MGKLWIVAPTIIAESLRRQFTGGVGLDALDLTAEPGEVLVLLGPNGAGKTTTVRLLNGVLTPDSGSASVLGLDPSTQGDELRQRTGVLTEHAGLDDRLTAFENLHFAAQIRGMKGADTQARIRELLERFAMDDRADRPVFGSSTGERKRLGLALALLHDPEVLFLDEPTSGLDPSATRAVIDLIGSLASEHGRTVVLCTHFLAEAGQLADRMAVLDHGKLIAFGRPDDLAAQLWSGLACDIELARPADTAVLARIESLGGVIEATAAHNGLHVRVADRQVVASVVRTLVEIGLDILAAAPRPPTLEDVYFELEARSNAGAA